MELRSVVLGVFIRIRVALIGLLLMAFAIGLAGCAHADRGMIWTEHGLTAAEGIWDKAYRERATICSSSYKPKTSEMETCFGEWYDADAKVETLVEVAVGSLQSYWESRARGEEPKQTWIEVAKQIAALVTELPPPARDIFERVKGVR